ncbi:glycosyl transferase family 1 [Paenibacillus sp. Soil766]|uniref:glycosyltransferase n=1 Tax=Paenibacillus sp. Soil766 TaxID=1736404 RepID=UPI00070F1E7B|nr:glycosyltransferase [Paenibacillus sp. Soil766]KRE97074.1 glycosyl transferase family 1 [Paenibacillus sp. Soil766]
MKKKILFVIDSLHSGGAEKSLISLLTLFDYQNYEVDLLMFSPEGLYLRLLPTEVNIVNVPKDIQMKRNRIIEIIKSGDLKTLFSRIGLAIHNRNPYAIKKMHGAQINWKWMTNRISKLEQNYDVAIAYSQGMPTYFVAEKVNAGKKISWFNTDYKSAKYNRKFDFDYFEKIDNIVTVSEACKDVLIENFEQMKEKFEVIYDIVSPKLIKEMSNKDKGFIDTNDGIRILTIGRLVDAKGYDLALEACNLLKSEGVNFRWYVLGEGPLKSEIQDIIKEKRLEDRFILLGVNSNPYPYIKNTDIYVQPSRFEGKPIAVNEAKVLCKPIVVTNFSTVNSQITNEKNGLIVEMNSQDIYKGIKKLINNNNLRQQISSNLMLENVGTEEEINKIYDLIKS